MIFFAFKKKLQNHSTNFNNERNVDAVKIKSAWMLEMIPKIRFLVVAPAEVNAKWWLIRTYTHSYVKRSCLW